MKCGTEVSGTEARKQWFGKIDTSRPLLCKKCRVGVVNQHKKEAKARRQAQYDKYLAEKKNDNSLTDKPIKKYKITNASKLVEAQRTFAEKQEQKQIDDLIGL